MTTERDVLPLRNGGQADVRSALAYIDRAEVVLRDHPRHFDTLLALADGRPEDAEFASRVFLQKYRLLDRQGELPPEWADILRSSYEVVGDGPHLSMPFDLTDAGATEAIARVQQRMDRDLDNFLGGGPGR